MSIYANIVSGVVENLFVADAIDVLPHGDYVLAHRGVYVGCPYENGEFIGVVDPGPEPEPLPPVPDPDLEPDPALMLEYARAAKLAEINTATDATLASLTGGYPSSELLTFDKQEVEARAYLADPTAPTPLLSALAAGRGMALSELVQRVIAKADAFASASGYIIGQRQALEDRLDAAETVEAVQAIEVNLSLPGGTA